MENLGLGLIQSAVLAIGVALLIVFWPFGQTHEGTEEEHSVDEEGEGWRVEDAA